MMDCEGKDYRKYGYKDDVPLVSRCEQMYDYLDKKFSSVNIDTDQIETTIENTINNSLGDINCKFCNVNCHIETAKKEIIETVKENSTSQCLCNLATKADVQQVIDDINKHTDSKFTEIDFNAKFEDLNEQVSAINNKIG